MTTFIGTKGNDFINGPVVAKDSNIDGDEGDDTIVLGINQLFLSGPGNDIIKGNGKSGYALWGAKGHSTVDLLLGYALDGFGFKDSISGIESVHGSVFGVTVKGTNANEQVYIFGGQNNVELGDGDDTVLYWDQKSSDFSIVFKSDYFEVKKSGSDTVDILRGVEFVEFRGGSYFEKRIALKDLIPLGPSGFKTIKGQLIDNADAIGNPRWVVTNLNHDSIKDLAIRFDPDSAFIVGPIASSPIHFFLGAVDGGFKQAPFAMSDNLAPTLANRILTADFNNDGLGDIVLAASGQDPYVDGKPAGPFPGEPSYILMSGSSGYKNITIPNVPSIFAHHASLGDINGDGAIDVFIDSIWTGFNKTSYFLMSDKKGSFFVDRTNLPESVKNAQAIERKDLSTNDKQIYDQSIYTSSAIFDANNDGWLDLAILPIGGTYSGKIFLNDGKGNFSDSSVLPLPPGPYGAGYVARFSNDVYVSAGSIYLDTKSLDINGDGRLDLVSVVTKDNRVGSAYEYYKGATVQVLINKLEGFVDESNNRINFQHAPESNFSHYDTIDTVDINADGFVDLLLYRGFNSPDPANNTRILLNDGKGQFKESNYPVGIPKGLLIPIDALKGEYVVVADAGNQFGQKNYQFRVDHASFDWASGLDFFSGRASALIDQKSDIPGRWLHGTNDSNRLTLDSGSEKAFGYAGNDLLTGLAGDDFIDGGVGLDVAIYRGNRKDYLVRWDNNGNLLVEDKRFITQSSNQGMSDGKDQLVSIERIKFVDESIAFDMSGSAGTTAKILGAIFGKESLSNKNYVGIGLSFLDTGWTYDNLAALALDAAGAKSNDQIVTLLWKNVVGTTASLVDKAPYIALLQNGMTPGTLAQLAANSTFNTSNINLVGLAQTGIEYIPVV
jgi:hypothetical protein